jgi:hypothetical protein
MAKDSYKPTAVVGTPVPPHDTGEAKPFDPTVGLIEGRMAHYVLPGGPNKGRHVAAVVVRVWGGGPTVNLVIFPDGGNDGQEFASYPTGWVTSVPYADPSENKVHTWHHIERV